MEAIEEQPRGRGEQWGVKHLSLSSLPFCLLQTLQCLISPTPTPLTQGFLRGQGPNSLQLPLSHLGFRQKCPDPNCRVKKSLHGHHPRDCLFYLRDWTALRLQKLLQVRGSQPGWLASRPGEEAGHRVAGRERPGCREIQQAGIKGS